MGKRQVKLHAIGQLGQRLSTGGWRMSASGRKLPFRLVARVSFRTSALFPKADVRMLEFRQNFNDRYRPKAATQDRPDWEATSRKSTLQSSVF